MKKFYMSMVAMLCGVAASAQIGSLSCGDISLTAGGEAAYLEVMLATEDVSAISGIQFFFGLPEGVSINQVWDEEDEAYVNDVAFPLAKKDHQKGLKVTEAGDLLAYVGGDASMTYKSITNPVLKLGVVAAKDAKDGEYTITFNKAAISDKSDPVVSYDVPDFTAKVTITGGTGINGVNADNENAPIYNLAGQRVSKAQKGIFIQNGKKSIK